jgi:hypothetical protein
MTRWQTNPQLASVRGEEALAALPDDEREPWRQLWVDLDDFVDRLRDGH